MATPPDPVHDLVDAGTRALAEGAWERGRDAFRKAVDLDDDPAAIEGLGIASWWLDDAPVVFEAHEQAFRLFSDRGDRLGAARMATWIGLDHYLYRGQVGPATGWMRRARRLLEGVPPSAELGWLTVWDAYLALMERNDVALAIRAGEEAARLAAELELPDLEMLAMALGGLARVGAGNLERGMRELDEAAAAALSGTMTNLDAIVTTLCFLIYACEQVRDFPRAVQWCDAVEDISRRWSYRAMFGVCRCHHAAVMLWRGDWLTAEQELTTAAPELMATRPGWLHESVVRLAGLRLRQGRIAEARRLFGQVPTHPLSLVGLAELALDEGEFEAARDLVERFQRRVPIEDRLGRSLGAEIAIRTWLQAGDAARARDELDGLRALAETIGTAPLRALASLCATVVHRHAGDLEMARRAAEDALDLSLQAGAPFEVARARIELATTLHALGRDRDAAREARAAIATFECLGAKGELARAASLLVALGISIAPVETPPVASDALTPREVDVLRLVARGRTNHEIAAELSISVRTVERHVSTIYGKIGVSGPAARASATVHAIESGLILATPPA